MRDGGQRVWLGIGELRANVGDHIAYLWEGRQEFVQAVGFLEEGLRKDEHVVVFGHDEANARVLEVLADNGHRPDLLQAGGRMSVLGPESTGEFILSRIGAAFQQAVDAGAPMIRLLGNIGWGHPDWPGEEDLLRFEAKVTAAAASFPCIVVCMYDVASLSGPVVLDGAFGTHPLTIQGNLIRENPMCLGIEEYLARLEGRQERAADE